MQDKIPGATREIRYQQQSRALALGPSVRDLFVNIFFGRVDHLYLDPHIETPEQVRDRTLEAAEFIPLEQLGTTDDCGFAPFCDDMSTSRDTAFAKIGARVVGTTLASRILGGD